MKSSNLLTCLLAIMLLYFSCNKSPLQPPSGTYTGTFTVIYHDSTLTGPTSLELTNSRQYVCIGNSNKIPAGASGTFTFSSGKMNFTDKNVWFADFDWNLILNREYNYTYDGRHLKLWAYKNNVGYYKYDLVKR